MSIQIVPVQSERRILVGEELKLRFKLFDEKDKRLPASLGALRVLVFEPNDGWQGCAWAQPVSGGMYETTVPAPSAGPAYVFFSCPESKIGYAHLPHLIIDTTASAMQVVSRAPLNIPADSRAPVSAAADRQ